MILLVLLMAVIATFGRDVVLSPHSFCLRGPRQNVSPVVMLFE